MSSLLDRILKKFGVENYEELSSEERATFSLWAKEMEGKQVTIPELRKFLENQQLMNISEFENFDNPKAKDFFIKVYSRICRQIISFIDMPEKVRKGREAALEELSKK